jgi:DNA-binding beta-propeller fold protein YncE
MTDRAGVNNSPNFTNPSGLLVVIDVATRGIVAEIDVGGQPDSIDVSPDGSYLAICIENERDEDLGDGRPPQLPGGFVWVIDITGPVQSWAPVLVDVSGLPGMLFPEDPEPEFGKTFT